MANNGPCHAEACVRFSGIMQVWFKTPAAFVQHRREGSVVSCKFSSKHLQLSSNADVNAKYVGRETLNP